MGRNQLSRNSTHNVYLISACFLQRRKYALYKKERKKERKKETIIKYEVQIVFN